MIPNRYALNDGDPILRPARGQTLRLIAATVTLMIPPIGLAHAQQADFQPEYGEAQDFSFETLTERARDLAQNAYAAPTVQQADILEAIDYDAHWRIAFRKEATVEVGDIPVQFFHLGTYFRNPVKMSVVENGEAREVLYDRDFFDMPEDSPARNLSDNAGFAGFRLMDEGLQSDWISFLGASYFRTSGPFNQYGMSARGLAIDSGMPKPEEFPNFTEFYIENAPEDDSESDVIIYALLDSPSVTGAYEMKIRDGEDGDGQKMEIASRLFFRDAVERLGVAPLTSMYWYSETNRVLGFDWRPEVHDADGLKIISDSGERLWRPLNNPDRVMTSSFVSENPRGFGLLQRDRKFENYEDDGVFYDKRASVWIEPLGDWGAGQVQLIEIPTDDEIYDNIVAFWNPADAPQPGDELSFYYALHWVDDAPDDSELAPTVATRIGAGGVPGQPRPDGHLKIVVDFQGWELSGLGQDEGVEPEITVPEGVTLEQAYALPVVGTDRWRLVFDISAEGVETADIRAYLSRDGAPLTETWLGQVHPVQFDAARPGHRSAEPAQETAAE